MDSILPPFFALTASLALIAALSFLWRSLRAAFGAADSFHLPSAEAESRRILEERKTALLSNLADLEFEHAGDKISDEDYEALDKKLRVEAKRVLRLLDDDVKPYRAKAEKRLKGYLSERGAPYRTTANAEVPASVLTAVDEKKGLFIHDDQFPEGTPKAAKELLAAALKKTIDEKNLLHKCSECETTNDADAVFCKKCGTSMEGADDSLANEEVDDEHKDDENKDDGDVNKEAQSDHAPKEDA